MSPIPIAIFSSFLFLCTVYSFRTVQNVSTKFVVSISKNRDVDADHGKNISPAKKRVKIASKQDSLPEIQMESRGEISNSSCHYEIRANDTNGSLMAGAKIGDSIYYVINCSGMDNGKDNEEASCIVVYNCTLTSDDQTLNYPIIDEYGCSFDRSIHESVEYDSDTVAGIRGQAIRFHGSPKIKLDCKIRKMRKSDKSTNCAPRRPTCVTNEYTSSAIVQ